MNSSGDSDLRTYYDGIKQQQESRLRVPLDWIFRVLARSERVSLPPDFNFEFATLYQMTPEQKGGLITAQTNSILAAYSQQVIGRATALRELRNSSAETGVFASIDDKDIEEAALEPPPGVAGIGGSETGGALDPAVATAFGAEVAIKPETLPSSKETPTDLPGSESAPV